MSCMDGPNTACHTPYSGSQCASSAACQSWTLGEARLSGIREDFHAILLQILLVRCESYQLYMLNLNQALEAFRSQQESRAASVVELLLAASREQATTSGKQPGRPLTLSAEDNYLDRVPENFRMRSDVLLKLDDGSELPAHSQYLDRFSSVCASMLDDDGPLSCASVSEKGHLRLTDCSRATAIKFLSALYSTQQYDYLKMNKDSCMAIAGLAHKLDVEVYLLLKH